MLKKALFILTTVILSSCMSMLDTSASKFGLPQKDKTYSVENTRMPSSKFLPPFWAFVNFEGNAYLKEQEDIIAKTELREPDYSLIPKGGYVRIRLNSRSPHDFEASRGENCTYIIIDGVGEELYRDIGSTDAEPGYTDTGRYGDIGRYGPRFYADDSVYLDENTTFPVRVRVISQLFPEDFYEYQIIKTAQ